MPVVDGNRLLLHAGVVERQQDGVGHRSVGLVALRHEDVVTFTFLQRQKRRAETILLSHLQELAHPGVVLADVEATHGDVAEGLDAHVKLRGVATVLGEELQEHLVLVLRHERGADRVGPLPERGVALAYLLERVVDELVARAAGRLGEDVARPNREVRGNFLLECWCVILGIGATRPKEADQQQHNDTNGCEAGASAPLALVHVFLLGQQLVPYS